MAYKSIKLLAMKNIDKTTIIEITKILNAIDLGSKYSWAINNTNIDAARNLRLITIKKYWRYIG